MAKGILKYSANQKIYLTESPNSAQNPVYPIRLSAGFRSSPRFIGASVKEYSIPIIPSIPKYVIC